MNNFHIITNKTKDQDQKITNYIRSFLESRGKICTDTLSQIDCVLVLGGDGTLLRAAGELAHLNAPFLGVNLGNLGFLAEVDKNHIERALMQIIAGDYTIEKRMMLAGVINEHTSKHNNALNDIVIAGHKSMQLIYFNLYVNGLMLSSYVADGMIISTPTGSTGYNLSAGGPLIEPRAQAILLTPICAHSMRSRSIILSPDDEVMIEIAAGKQDERQTVEVIFDGHSRLEMETGDCVKVTKSEKTTSIIKLSKTNFFEILKQKL
jgi:NAD+ kinase